MEKTPTPGAMLLDQSCRIGKRIREDDEVYLDNFHSNKRYLTEVIASSLNCLKVGDVDISAPPPPPAPPPELTDTHSRSDIKSSSGTFREEASPMDSPMSDDSEDSVGYRLARIPLHSCETSFTCPGSPDRNQTTVSPRRSLARSYSCPLSPSTPSTTTNTTGKQRSHDSESRFPPSPSDPCQPPDLRRAALLRSMQIRAYSPGGMSPHCMYEPRLQHILDRENYRQVIPAEQSEVLLASPLHSQALPVQPCRPSSSARSLLLEEEKLAESPVAMVDEECNGESGAVKRTRSRGGAYRRKRGTPHKKRCADISDTESSL